MNITKNSKIKPDKPIQSKPSFLIISTNYQLETLYHILIKNPLLVNTKDSKGETFLSYAIKRKNIEIAELILTSPKLDYNFQDKNGNSYLHLAVINRLINIAKILLEKKININMQNNEGNTALHFAFSTGSKELINLMIDNKIDFSIKNKIGLIGEEIKEGTFQEILDNFNGNYLNKNSISINNSNIYDIKDKAKEINNNPDNEIQNSNIINNNEIILNDKCQINKSIKIDWENNDNNIMDVKKNNINLSNTLNSNLNKSGTQQNSQIKYSLVNLSYSEESDEETKLNLEKQKEKEMKNSMKSSDIFDLCSSATYQEKLANMNIIHTVGEPKIILKKESSESNINDDIVNININKIEINQNNSININNIFQNGLQTSQNSFQTSYEKGRKNLISNINNENGLTNINIENDKNEFKKNENMIKKGNKIIMDFCKSLNKEDIFQNKFQYNKKESDISSNNDNNIQSKIETNDNFIFSPFTSLKKTLNSQINGSEINKDINNNKNSNEFSNININDEIKNIEKNNIKKYKTLNISSPIINKYESIKENNIEILSQKSQSIKERDSNILNIDDFNMSITNIDNINTNNTEKINFDCPINSSEETSTSSPIIKQKDSLNIFLSEIRLEHYYSLLKNNGFDDIQLLLDQSKNGIAITDKQLKLSGINIPGDRAKILIRLQEKAGNFSFPIPNEVYYINQNKDYNVDKNINKIKNWLEELKIGNYLENFIKNGYQSLELMMLQMETKNPLTDEILKEEIGIDKIGHRSRIINKLIEDSKHIYNKWKNPVLIIGADITKKICDCNIF